MPVAERHNLCPQHDELWNFPSSIVDAILIITLWKKSMNKSKKSKLSQKEIDQAPGECKIYKVERRDSDTNITVVHDETSGDRLFVGKNGTQDLTTDNLLDEGLPPLDTILTPGVKVSTPTNSKDSDDPDLLKDVVFDFPTSTTY